MISCLTSLHAEGPALPQKASILLDLDDVPTKFKLPSILTNILGVHTASKAQILVRLWIYIKKNSLLSPDNPQVILCDGYLQHVRWPSLPVLV
jgi:chromatin remodeling complex protein RSC6